MLVQSISEWFSKMANGVTKCEMVWRHTHGQWACCNLWTRLTLYIDDARLYIAVQSICYYVMPFAICHLGSHSKIDCKGWGSPGCSHTAAFLTTTPLVKLSQTGVKLQVLDYVRMCSTIIGFDSISHISSSSALYTCVGGMYVVPALQ